MLLSVKTFHQILPSIQALSYSQLPPTSLRRMPSCSTTTSLLQLIDGERMQLQLAEDPATQAFSHLEASAASLSFLHPILVVDCSATEILVSFLFVGE